ncbi:phytanoyl-CoA dioxygenase family protein [Roseofilum casamattae]|uniref:Phytanoyl-CoA dioxygenase family protein n=1 Tax=Roseofilum casamattae BLCC-M143 TaxID=3022442 RepID=A0ABT7BR25_9CYAN|nr:phytanoyl-CoA dioxygenase family protein [Roseofilum casamattae]MDJ1181651.1 phytanoyl-CoA dioxygenase family protein [Roseofilum casamattae BLCC-M143]
MELDRLKQEWDSNGYCIIPALVTEDGVSDMRSICDRVLEQVLQESDNRAELEDASNIAYLTEPKYYSKEPESLLKLLEFIAQDQIVLILQSIADGQFPLFHNTQYFKQPLYRSWQGIWHRDTQFLAPDPELEKQRIAEFTAVHFRVAFCDDACLEYVPGSEKRWDTPAELAIRKKITEGNITAPAEMPGAKTINLRAGDACLFHAWGIHRGTYRQDLPRRTLDIIYQWGGSCDYYPPPPTCFAEPKILESLSDGAQEFYRYFINAYKKVWQALE